MLSPIITYSGFTAPVSYTHLAMAAFEAPSNQENGVMQVLGKLLEVHAPQGGAGDF